MRNNMLLLMFLIVLLASCNQKIDEADLIGGTWTATAGYEDGEPEREPYCVDFIMEGLEFKKEELFIPSFLMKSINIFLKKEKKE